MIQHFLKPNGEFIMVEFHPVIWMFDDDFTKVAYDYQSTEPIVETYEGTYADRKPIFPKNMSCGIMHFLKYFKV